MGTNFKLPYLKTLTFTYGAQYTCLKPMTPAADCATYLAFLVELRPDTRPTVLLPTAFMSPGVSLVPFLVLL